MSESTNAPGKWEQRVCLWGGLLLTGITLAMVFRLERDRFQNPLAAPLGVTWDKLKFGGANTAPVDYIDVLTLTNPTESSVENVEVVLANWVRGTEYKILIGTLAPGKTHRINFLSLQDIGCPREIDPKDVVVVRCTGFMDKRIPVKELGKDHSLREDEAQENKENDADPEYWSKLWRWEKEMNRQGIKVTEAEYNKWLKEKERERKAMRQR